MPDVKQAQNKTAVSDRLELSPTLEKQKTAQIAGAQSKFGGEVESSGSIPSLVDLQCSPPIKPRSQVRDFVGSRRPLKTKRRRQSGWSVNKSLHWREVKEIGALIHDLSRHGAPLNVFVSIRPEGAAQDQHRKRACYRLEDALRKRFKRHGMLFVGVRVFEKPIGGLLHLHALVNVPRGQLNKVLAWGDPPNLDIITAKPHHVAYITKQRRPLPPSLEKLTHHRRQRGVPFRGQRWSLTKDAKALLNSRRSS